jgi:hypothetical protein
MNRLYIYWWVSLIPMVAILIVILKDYLIGKDKK